MQDQDGDDDAGLPRHNRDQECTFCHATRPSFAHRLDPAHAQFLFSGEQYTLPRFFAVCRDCEVLVGERDDESLLGLLCAEYDEDRDLYPAMLAAFHLADMGVSPLPDS